MAGNEPDSSAHWVVYTVACADASPYTGITNALERRVAAHNAGQGARHTPLRRPATLVYSEGKGTFLVSTQTRNVPFFYFLFHRISGMTDELDALPPDSSRWTSSRASALDDSRAVSCPDAGNFAGRAGRCRPRAGARRTPGKHSANTMPSRLPLRDNLVGTRSELGRLALSGRLAAAHRAAGCTP